jgi:hypothetical protein
MGRFLLETAGSYNPDTLKLLCRAFDEAWEEEIAHSYPQMNAEERRTRLALIILELANNGERHLDDIKETALEIMRLKERPGRFDQSPG